MRWRARRVRSLGYRPSVIGYTGYGSTSWIRLLARVLLTRDSKRPKGVEPSGSRGWRSFTSVPVENGAVDVVIDDQRFSVRADSSGIVDTVIDVDLSPGWHTAELSSEGSTPTISHVNVFDPDVRFGIVSDIDDTVMVTALPRPLLAAWHTFVVNEHARTSTPGMPVLYERLVTVNERTPVIYLSTGAWNVAPTLTRFLSRNLYPKGALLLTDWGPTADRWFRSGREHKHNSLERLAREFPRDPVAAHRRRRSARRVDLRRVRGLPSRSDRGRLHPATDPRRGRAGRQHQPRVRRRRHLQGHLAVRQRRRRALRPAGRTRAHQPRAATRGHRLSGAGLPYACRFPPCGGRSSGGARNPLRQPSCGG